MKRRKFIGIAGASALAIGGASYLLSDRYDFVRANTKHTDVTFSFMPDENEILYLASLAPSGHNTQPWSVTYLEPYHWIIGNDRSRWLPAVDPGQRETILSIGAFVQNLEYAANGLGYTCDFRMIGHSNQDEDIIEIKLTKKTGLPGFDAGKIRSRRTMRSGYLKEKIRKEHIDFITSFEEGCYYFPNTSHEHAWLNEQTIEANRLQVSKDDVQLELSEWMRFSSNDAKTYLDGLTTASLELDGMASWFVRNFYTKKDVMKPGFRKQGVDRVREQVSNSGGWLLITGKDNTTNTLVESGRSLQRILLRIREKSIGIHPMTQVLEETATRNTLDDSIGLTDPVQFVLRIGYVKHYPDPVSLRRPVESLIKNQDAGNKT